MSKMQGRNRDIVWRRALTGEPLLSDMLNDPIVEMLMARDDVSREDIHGLVQRFRPGPGT